MQEVLPESCTVDVGRTLDVAVSQVQTSECAVRELALAELHGSTQALSCLTHKSCVHVALTCINIK